MAGGWAIDQSLANPAGVGIQSASTAGVDLFTGDTNSYGAWTEVISETPSDITHLLVQPNLIPNNSGQVAYSIAAAPSGSEPSGLIIQNLVFTAYGGPVTGAILLPVGPIAAGSRLAAQSASGTAFDNSNLALTGFDCGSFGQITGGAPSIWDTYGWDGSAGTLAGITVDPGATANTKGAYVTIAASIVNDLRGFFLGFDYLGNMPPAGFDINTLLVDVALGAAGGEVIILPDLFVGHLFGSDGSIEMVSVTPVLSDIFLMPIKAGTRIAVRAQSSSATSPDNLIGVSLYGLRA
jgi:hypothetical protein